MDLERDLTVAKIPAVYQGSASNLFDGITPTCDVAPLTTYSLATFPYLRPDWRVKWGVKTFTLTWSGVNAGINGEIFILPVSNLDVGAAVATLTNAAGLSQAITIPGLPLDGIPLTAVVDLSLLANRASATWHCVVSGNAVNVTLGAAIALYGPKTTFLNNMSGNNFAWEYPETETHGKPEQKNEYFTRFILDTLTRERSIEVLLRANDAGAPAIKAWHRSSHGGALPSLFWPDPNVNDALLGTLGDLKVLNMSGNFRPIQLTFTELSKGIPLL